MDISGTSIGAINAALLVSYVKENKTWEGSGERLVAGISFYTIICRKHTLLYVLLGFLAQIIGVGELLGTDYRSYASSTDDIFLQ